jgi:hypothetical protein
VRTQERLESLEVHHSKTPESESKGDLSLATILYACGRGGEDSDPNGITKSGNSRWTKFTTMIQFQMFCTLLV